jgi:hypothetical protein
MWFVFATSSNTIIKHQISQFSFLIRETRTYFNLGFDAIAAAVGRSRWAKASYMSSIHLEEIEATVTTDKQQNQKSNWYA